MSRSRENITIINKTIVVCLLSPLYRIIQRSLQWAFLLNSFTIRSKWDLACLLWNDRHGNLLKIKVILRHRYSFSNSLMFKKCLREECDELRNAKTEFIMLLLSACGVYKCVNLSRSRHLYGKGTKPVQQIYNISVYWLYCSYIPRLQFG